MAKVKIVHDVQTCIGCGACVSICPDNWEMRSDGKSYLKNSKQVGEKTELELNDIGCNQEAADSCPVECIHIVQ